MATITTRAAKGSALTHNEVDDNFLNLNASLAVYDGAFQIAAGVMEVNYTFRLEDPTDITKKAEFVMSGITTGTTRQYTMPNASGTLATLANTSQTFLGSTTFAPTTNSGTVTIGATPQTGTLTFGRSTVTQTVDIAVGATTAVSTKTVNIGTTGVSGSTTNINFGSAVSGALVTHIWNAGANSMRFDSSGNLGVGTTSPGAKLDVHANDVFAIRSLRNTGNGGLSVTDTAGGIRLGTSNGSTGYIGAAIDIQAPAAWTAGSSQPSDMRFFTVPSGSTTLTERMRLDSAGNLGLGVTPSAWSSDQRALQLKNGSGATGAFVADSAGNVVVAQNSYYNAGWKYQKTGTASIAVSMTGGGFSWNTAASGTADIGITFTQAMTLDASGNLLVGQTSTGYVNSDSLGIEKVGGRLVVNHLNGTASGTFYAAFGYNAIGIGSITQSGTTAVLYNTTSDSRLKENIMDADASGILIDTLRVRQFDWKADGSHQRYGFVAQELVEVAPEAVHQPADEDEMMAVDYSKLVPMLVKELQSLRARVAVLETV